MVFIKVPEKEMHTRVGLNQRHPQKGRVSLHSSINTIRVVSGWR
jgi:hypothetical protein